jgi:hypothetical protein
MKDEKLEAALKQFAEIVPENVLKQMLNDVVPAKNEVAGVGLAALAANPKYVGILVRKIASFLQEVTGVDIDKIPFIDKATLKPSDFFFRLNRGLDKLRKNNSAIFKALMIKMAVFDTAGAIAVFSGQDQKVINILIKAFELDLPLAGTDGETADKDTSKQKQIGKSSAPPPSVPPKTQKTKKVKPLGGGDKFFSSFQEQIDRMQTLAGINKKVL